MIEPAEGSDAAQDARKKRRRVPPETLRALDFLKDAIADHGEPLSRAGFPKLMATKIDRWRDRLKQRGLYDSDAASRQRFARAKERLIAEQLITIDDDLVWVVPIGRRLIVSAALHHGPMVRNCRR